MADTFVPLVRTFRELSLRSEDGDDVDYRSRAHGQKLAWADLLTRYRTVILSEAGSGKTEEIRHAAQTLREKEPTAFFLRLEHAYEDFDLAFEEGNSAEFDAWLKSDAEGWLFLDSIDEARLREPRDFERAIRRVGQRAGNALQRLHIVISGRGSAWRPVTDLALCEAHLPYHPPLQTPLADAKAGAAAEGAKAGFRIVALDDLNAAQVQTFAKAREVKDTKALMTAIDRTDAWSMAARPDDLAELVAFWNANGCIGNRLELMDASIHRRLSERDQNRAEAMPLSENDALAGARQIASAVTMAQGSLIRVPDGAQNGKGLPAAEILPDWTARKLSALLSRPIFDEAIYGAVRFHHRTVREFLTAQWLKSLLERETSRRKVEALLFRSQYGQDVIVPAMRPVLAWLILMDERIRTRTLALSPELIFEGGEPKALPLQTRRAILASVCESMLTVASSRSTSDYRAVQRFADTDLASDVKALFVQYAASEDVQNFLTRLVWQGEISAALPEVKSIAANPKTGVYTCIAAIRAVFAIGKPKDMQDVREGILSEAKELDRELSAELIAELPPTKAGIEWLLACVQKLKAKARHHHDGLSNALDTFVTRLDLDAIPALVARIAALLDTCPYVERRHCEISQKHGWMIKSGARAVERLVAARHAGAFEPASLAILQKLPTAQFHRDWGLNDIKSNLPSLITAWPDLNDALFWNDINVARKSAKKDNEGRVTRWYQTPLFRSHWGFVTSDFERVLEYVSTRTFLDDKLIALSLAFRLYTDAKRPKAWRELMKRTAKGSSDLEDALHQHLHPAPDSDANKRWRRQEADYKRRQKQREALNAQRAADWKAFLSANVEVLRHPPVTEPDAITDAQYYVHENMRAAARNSGHWSAGNWRSLEHAFGADVTRAFRDGVIQYWRRNNPKPLSQSKTRTGTPFSTIFGLTGLCIEARETQNWTATLSAAEATRAARYAVEELNGFPDWLPALYAAFPHEVLAVLLSELDYNLKIETAKTEHHYILSDLSWGGAWAWPLLGPEVQARLKTRTPKHLRNLEYMLTILQGSELDDATIARLAEEKCADRRLAHAARWYAVWVGVEPDKAIPAITERLKRTGKGKTQLAMHFVTALLGSRRVGLRARDAFRTAPHLNSLYQLIHRYVRQKDDIERAGKGVYSPGLRDDAQDTRHQLFSLLKEIPGKQAYLALVELSHLHPEASSRPWMLHLARSKAEADADLTPWRISQTLEFQSAIERTPTTHRELFELAQLRLLDLKDELEEGDSSIADVLIAGATQETQMRKYIGGWCRDRAKGRYVVPQEEEFADAKRADIRFHGVGFDAPVPTELKLADKWSGEKLFERLENQLCGDYLRDARSNRGMFVLVRRGEKVSWKLPGRAKGVAFEELVDALRARWLDISDGLANVEDVAVIGIDLTRRAATKETE